MHLPENYLQVFEEARRYDEAGDSYHAIKLYKKVTRLVPDFVESYRFLGKIYHQRREWKPAFHYWKMALSLDADERDDWWHLGLAAVGLKKMRVAQSVWSKFGYDQIDLSLPLGLKVRNQKEYEVLWMQPLDASRCRIMSIPMPGSKLKYRQTMLYNRRGKKGSTIVASRRVLIFESLATLKSSPYETFSCLLHTSDPESLKKIEQLAYEAGLGFEIWSNATRSMTIEHQNAFPEYHNDIIPRATNENTLIALAAIHPAEVERILNDWQIICLGQYSDLRSYG